MLLIALPGLDDAGRRLPVDPATMPWRAIGRVQTELGGRCTGFLIAPRVAVTAAHCLYLARPRGYLRPGSVHMVIGYDGGRFAGHARAVSFVIGPGYDPTDEARTVGADWAVLVLDTPLGRADQVLPLLRAPAAVGAAISLAGYDQDREERMLDDPDCRVTGWTGDGGARDMMRHDCEATRGSSGAPLLARGAHGGWEVVGLQVEAAIGHAGGAAVPSYVIAAPGSGVVREGSTPPASQGFKGDGP